MRYDTLATPSNSHGIYARRWSVINADMPKGKGDVATATVDERVADVNDLLKDACF